MSTKINDSLLPSGHVIQVVSQVFPTLIAFVNQQIPIDDTIPQITEGFEVMSMSMTPKMANSTLHIMAIFQGTYNVGHSSLPIAIFRDSGPNAIGAANFGAGAATAQTFPVIAIVSSGSTATTTIRVRAGTTDTNEITFNGGITTGVRYFGGVANSSITVTEIAP